MKALTAVLLTALLSFGAWAESREGVEFTNTKTVEGKSLVLNGIGIRKKLRVIKVYLGALYLEKKTNNADDIINATGTKNMVLHFLRSVSSSSIESAFRTAYNNNCGSLCAAKQRHVDEFLAQIVDANNGDQVEVTLNGAVTKLYIKGSLRYEVSDADITKIVLKMFLGPNPASEELRDGMLGK